MNRNTTIAILTASVFALASACAFADDKISEDVIPAEQAQMKRDADAKKAAMAKMTPERKAAAAEVRGHDRKDYPEPRGG
jgi:hypothetical protein